MMSALITIVLALVLGAGLLCLFLWVKTPYYRVDASAMVRVLEMVITGQATDNDWNLTFGMTIRHAPELEALRQRCLDIEEAHYTGESNPPYLFSSTGITELKEVLEEIRKQLP